MAAASSLSDSNNRFALDLFAQLAEPRENLFFSPLSIFVALAMTSAGARGETAAEMTRVLGLGGGEADHEALGKLLARWNTAGRGKYELAVANSLWGQKGETFLAEFLALVERCYGGGLNQVDFQSAAEKARKSINRWVEEKTKQRIKNLIPEGGLNDLTRLVLVNAVYFKGQWASQFEKRMTRDQPFYLETGGSVKVPLMHQQEKVRYFHGNGFQAVDLAYEGEELSVLVLLPQEKTGLRELERRLSAELLRGVESRLREQEVKTFLPRFKLTWGTANLTEPLCEMGMPTAFDGDRADFSGINGQGPESAQSLSISKVFHRAFVEVNEEGSEAAAATAVVMAVRGMPSKPPAIPTFRADHPFLFAIRERQTGVILFLGRVMAPAAE